MFLNDDVYDVLDQTSASLAIPLDINRHSLNNDQLGFDGIVKVCIGNVVSLPSVIQGMQRPATSRPSTPWPSTLLPMAIGASIKNSTIGNRNGTISQATTNTLQPSVTSDGLRRSLRLNKAPTATK